MSFEKNGGEVVVPGAVLTAAVRISAVQNRFLVAALFFTVFGVFIGGNVLVLQSAVLKASLPIGGACFALLAIFACVSILTGNAGFSLVVTYGLVLLLTYTHWQWLVYCVYWASVLCCIYLLRVLRLGRREVWLALLMGGGATITLLGCELAYASFNMLQRLGAGSVSNDTLFQASIASMIKNYGVVSTGLNGLVETPYHVLSHKLIAGISLLSGVSVFETYGVAPQVLLLPFVIFSATTCALYIGNEQRDKVPYVWGAVCVVFFMAPFLLTPWDLRFTYYVSESYFVSLGLFLFGLQLLFKRDLGFVDVLTAFSLAWLMTMAKASVGLVYLGLWFLRLVFLRRTCDKRDLLVFILVGLSVGYAAISISGAAGANYISPLSLIVTHSFHGADLGAAMEYINGSRSVPFAVLGWAIVAVISFFALHFVFSWVVIFESFRLSGWRSMYLQPAALYSLGSLGAGSLIVALFFIPGGSAYYFTNVSFFVSLPVVSIMMVRGFESAVLVSGGRKKLIYTIVAVLIVIFALLALRGAYRLSKMYRNSSFSSDSLIGQLISIRNNVPNKTVLNLAAESAFSNPQPTCWAQPFVYPAISERAWMGVIPPSIQCKYKYYGYGHYGLQGDEQLVSTPAIVPEGVSVVNWPDLPQDQKY